MDSMREIRAKIKAVNSIERVTRSMKMIAGVRLHQAEQRLVAGRPYAAALRALLTRVTAGMPGAAPHPLLQEREIWQRRYVLLTSDRSLCGGYNFGVVRLAEPWLLARGAKTTAIGKFGYRYFRHLGAAVTEYPGLTENADFAAVSQLGAELVRDFLNGEADEVNLIYTRFGGRQEQTPVRRRLLPVTPADWSTGAVTDQMSDEYRFEPSAAEVFRFLVPKYVNQLLYQTILEAKASEHAARLLAMETATQNATDLVRELELEYNRSRQEAITAEIVEIMGAVEINPD